jgi:hypothetical protein
MLILDCHNCGSENIEKRTASICSVSDGEALVCTECFHVHLSKCEECKEYLSKKSMEDLVCDNCAAFIFPIE